MNAVNVVTDSVIDCFKQWKPQIKIGTGTALLVGGSVWACYQTTKLKAINDAHLAHIKDIHDGYACLSDTSRSLASVQKNYRKDISKARLMQFKDLALLYSGPLAAEAVGVALIANGTGDLTTELRNTAIAYTGLLSTFREHRRRTANVVGEEKEEMILRGIEEKEVEEIDEKGKVHKKVTKVKTGEDLSPYARLFSETTADMWDRNPEVTKNFLLMQQSAAQNIFDIRLKTKGYGWLYFNEVLDMLGFPMTDEGQDVGWYYNPDKPDEGNTDGKIDFGIMNSVNSRFIASSSTECLENSCWLDFNCCGNIRPLIYCKSKRKLGDTRRRQLPKR